MLPSANPLPVSLQGWEKYLQCKSEGANLNLLGVSTIILLFKNDNFYKTLTLAYCPMVLSILMGISFRAVMDPKTNMLRLEGCIVFLPAEFHRFCVVGKCTEFEMYKDDLWLSTDPSTRESW